MLIFCYQKSLYYAYCVFDYAHYFVAFDKYTCTCILLNYGLPWEADLDISLGFRP